MNIYKKKYRIFSLFSCVILCAIFLCGSLLTSFVFASDTYWSNNQDEILKGSGSASDPYQISNAGQLYYFIYSAPNQYANIITDIDCSAHTWDGKAITKSFTLNGNGRGITNLYCNQQYGGLVGQNINTYSVMTFKNLSISTNAQKIFYSVNMSGLFVGSSSGTVTFEKCTTSGVINGTGTRGGLVGFASTINAKQCLNYVTINSSANNGIVGGICATTNYVGQVNLCGNYANLSGYYVGGIIGQVNGSNICNMDRCFNNGVIKSYNKAGGLIGQVSKADLNVESSYNIGDVSGIDAGGIAGDVSGDIVINNSYNAGLVTSNSNNNYIYTTKTFDIKDEVGLINNEFFELQKYVSSYGSGSTSSDEIIFNVKSLYLGISITKITYLSEIKDTVFVNRYNNSLNLNNSFSVAPTWYSPSTNRTINFDISFYDGNFNSYRSLTNCLFEYRANGTFEKTFSNFQAYEFDKIFGLRSDAYKIDQPHLLVHNPGSMNLVGVYPDNTYVNGVYCNLKTNTFKIYTWLISDFLNSDGTGNYTGPNNIYYEDYGTFEFELPSVNDLTYYSKDDIKIKNFGAAFEKSADINDGYPYLKDIYW